MATFEGVTDVYEALVDWPKRLAHESPFYRRLFDRLGAKSVVDVACGTGHHAALFHDWGLRVEAADLSTAMIERARSRFGESSGLRWSVRGFDQPIPCEKPFDAAICMGNSLSLADGLATVRQAIRQMFSAVRPGGAVVIQVLNLWRLAEGPCLWQKCQPVSRGGSSSRDTLVLKGVHRCGSLGYIEMVAVDLANPASMQSETIPLLGLELDDFRGMAGEAGAAHVAFFGGYEEEPYERNRSVDLVMVAEK